MIKHTDTIVHTHANNHTDTSCTVSDFNIDLPEPTGDVQFIHLLRGLCVLHDILDEHTLHVNHALPHLRQGSGVPAEERTMSGIHNTTYTTTDATGVRFIKLYLRT